MGQLVDLIDSAVFRKHTAMCIGTYEFSGVAWFLRGYARAISDASQDSVDEMEGFREWLHQRLEGACNIDWASLIIEKYGTGEEATQLFFRLFDEFRCDVEMKGLESILRDHAEYERQRYGCIASSRYR